MTNAEKNEFLYLFYSSDKDVKDCVLKILKGEEPLDEVQDQRSHKD